MKRRVKEITDKIRNTSVGVVINVLKEGLKGGGTTISTQECIEFVRKNKYRVSKAYFESVRIYVVHVSWAETEMGYKNIIRSLEMEQTRYDNACRKRRPI